MNRVSAGCVVVLFLVACGGGSSGVTPSAPAPAGGGGPPATIAVTEIPVPVTPLYVGADSSGAYFGFGSSGTGSNLYSYRSGAIAQTQPDPGSNGFISGGGVYGIAVPNASSSVYWFSAYFGNDAATYVQVECGAGTTATLCAPFVQEPTAVAIDGTNDVWVGGLTFNGGGQIRTTAQRSYDSDSFGVIALAAAGDGTMWGILQSESLTPADEIVQFTSSGSQIGIAQTYKLATGSHAGALTFAGDGRLWFTDFGRSAIGTITAQGKIHEFATPHALVRPSYAQSQIVSDCDGSLWFTESDQDAVVRMTTNGAFREVRLPTPGAYPAAIAAPARSFVQCTRTVWVGEARAQRLAQITY